MVGFTILFCVALVPVVFYSNTDLLPLGIILLIRGAYGVVIESIALSQPLERQPIILELNHDGVMKATGFFHRRAAWRDIIMVKRWRKSNDEIIDRDGWLFVKKYNIFNIFIADNHIGQEKRAFIKELSKYYHGPIAVD